jgi:penicillin-binding protein 2
MSFIEPSQLGQKREARTVGHGWKSLFLIVLTLLMTAGIGSRLIYLQFIKGPDLLKRAESNRIRLIPKLPERGNIFDKNGKILATTRYPHSVYLWPMAHKKEGSWNKVAPRLSQILGIPEQEIIDKLEDAGPNASGLVRISRDITLEQITALKEYENDLPGVEVHTEAVRQYPRGKELAHVLGYTRELTGEQLKKRRDQGYRLGDVIGQMGAEKAFEGVLRGEWGGQQVEVDGRGRPIRVLGEKQAKPGKDIRLTIDLDLQLAAHKALQGQNGTIIVMDPKNGGILAMASNPTFDINVFSKHKPNPKELESILLNPEHPLLNRALRAYPPASTFKIVTTAAGMESGLFSPKLILPTYASLTFGGTTFGEHNKAGFGPLGWTGAMAKSSDTFFYQIAARLFKRDKNGDTLINWTRKFGFGARTGFELVSEESRGLVPDNEYKLKTMKRDWSIGDSVNMSIGQGALLATPLQTAVMFGVPASGGYRLKPHLLKDNEEAKNWRESVNMSPTTLKIIKDGLRETVTKGTAKKMDVPTLPPISGKTGTAEAWKRSGVKANHAWFGAYAPTDKPEIVILAFAEHSGDGGSAVAAPMALKVMEDYFQRKYPGKYQKPQEEKVEQKTSR